MQNSLIVTAILDISPRMLASASVLEPRPCDLSVPKRSKLQHVDVLFLGPVSRLLFQSQAPLGLLSFSKLPQLQKWRSFRAHHACKRFQHLEAPFATTFLFGFEASKLDSPDSPLLHFPALSPQTRSCALPCLWATKMCSSRCVGVRLVRVSWS